MPLLRRHTEPALNRGSIEYTEASEGSSIVVESNFRTHSTKNDLHVCHICDVNTQPGDCPLNRAKIIEWAEKDVEGVSEGEGEPEQKYKFFFIRTIVNYLAGSRT